jgi:hypothetical protein
VIRRSSKQARKTVMTELALCALFDAGPKTGQSRLLRNGAAHPSQWKPDRDCVGLCADALSPARSRREPPCLLDVHPD